MRRGRHSLILAGAMAFAAPAIASDKLPAKAPPPSSMATTPAPAEMSDPSVVPPPIPDTAAPAEPPAPQSVINSQPPVAANQPLPGTDPDKYPAAYPFVLFFDLDSVDITPGAADVLNNVVNAYRKVAAGHVTLSGYTDSSGSGGHNKDLSQRRVAAVKAFLVAKSVPADAIATEALGETKPLIDTADGMHEPQNRRVEITVSSAAGGVSTR